MIDRERIEAVRRDLSDAFTDQWVAHAESGHRQGEAIFAIQDRVHAFLADVEQLVAENERLRRERGRLAHRVYVGHMPLRSSDVVKIMTAEPDPSGPLADALAAHDREAEPTGG